MSTSSAQDHRPLDHRDLNREMAVFATDPLVGPGLPIWLPAGAAIRQELEALARDIARRDGCLSVYSPVLGKRALFERSGHWAKFSEMPVEEVQDAPARALADDLCAAGLRAGLQTEGSLGARVRASRQRRDCLVAVIGPAEAAADQVQVTDVAAGFRGRLQRRSFVDAVRRAYAARALSVEWEGASLDQGAASSAVPARHAGARTVGDPARPARRGKGAEPAAGR